MIVLPSVAVMGATGAMVPPEDLDAAARAITTYAADPDLQAQHGALSRTRASTFNWSSCAAQTFPELLWADRVQGRGHRASEVLG